MKKILLLLALSSCTESFVLTPPVNHDGPLPTGTIQDCAAMCGNLRHLHCPAGDPTPQGASCEDVCQNTESSGYASENPRCQAIASSCEVADACSDAPPP